jgi:hypothetical protein
MNKKAKITQKRDEKYIVNPNNYWKETLHLLYETSVELKFPQFDLEHQIEIITGRDYEDKKIVTFAKV